MKDMAPYSRINSCSHYVNKLETSVERTQRRGPFLSFPNMPSA